MTGALLPTAASASLPMKCPTTAISIELNSSCSRLLAAKGSAKNSMFLNNGPFSMSISLFFGFLLAMVVSLMFYLNL